MNIARLLALVAFLAGAICVIAGVQALAGTGWALLATGGFCILTSIILIRGVE